MLLRIIIQTQEVHGEIASAFRTMGAPMLVDSNQPSAIISSVNHDHTKGTCLLDPFLDPYRLCGLAVRHSLRDWGVRGSIPGRVVVVVVVVVVIVVVLVLVVAVVVVVVVVVVDVVVVVVVVVHGGWRRKTLIGDAKFETVANKEFQKQERRLSKADSFCGEEGFAPGLLPDAFPDDYLAFNVLVTLREGVVSLAKVIRVFEPRTLFDSVPITPIKTPRMRDDSISR
ncbi:tyrosine hydroxylase [Elysia marginata]|uniref:Tyrosine hydroxylase n=1 Tax=Elysia marginata TaxID=1093978 RepID=A0AAV4J119_9GAST|nr:tyrosine hydroxylase [Elysia marginata]